MQFNVAQLLKEPIGAIRRYELQEALDPLDPELEFLGPLIGTLQLIRVNTGILATGEFSTAVRVTCNRCLEPIAMPVRFFLEENFHPSTEVYTGRPLRKEEYEGDADEFEDQSLTIDPNHILDIQESVRQNIWLAMPMYPACNWTGSGECPNLTAYLQSLQGITFTPEGAASAVKESIDPRWQTLLELQDRNNSESASTQPRKDAKQLKLHKRLKAKPSASNEAGQQTNRDTKEK
jgi:uncharacterized protein